METRRTMPRRHSLTLPADKWDSPRFTSIFLASGLYCSQAESCPTHLRLTQTVETVEKVGKFNNYCKAMGFYKPEEPNGKIQTL
jgi:hypothetical protein